MRLRAASDLVATHFHRDGRPRTPEASATDPRALDVGLVDLGHLAGSILAAEEPLALRALQAGVSENVVAKQLPGLGHLAEVARDMSTIEIQDAGARMRLEALPQTWTPIRTDDPLTELADRMHRLRHVTFDMSATPGDTLANLRDISTIGIAVHAHAAAFHGAQLTTAADPTGGAHGAEALLLRGIAWQRLHRDLSRFVTLAPPAAPVRADLVALARLLPRLAPLDTQGITATLADPQSRRIGASLNGAVATMAQVGTNGAAAFADLARAGNLRLDARDLPRSLVTDDPELASERLAGPLVQAPVALLNSTRAAYRTVQQHPVGHAALAVPTVPSAASRPTPDGGGIGYAVVTP